MSESTLRMMFNPYGCITCVEKKDDNTYANINFEDHDDLVYAIVNLQGECFMNQNLELQLSMRTDL